jgi:hypothetical protein
MFKPNIILKNFSSVAIHDPFPIGMGFIHKFQHGTKSVDIFISDPHPILRLFVNIIFHIMTFSVPPFSYNHIKWRFTTFVHFPVKPHGVSGKKVLTTIGKLRIHACPERTTRMPTTSFYRYEEMLLG